MRIPRPRAATLTAAALVAACAAARAPATTVPTSFHDERAALVSPATLDRPVGMAFLPDGRLLLVEQKSRKIRLVVDATLSGVDPVATLPGIRTTGNEQGLLGIAVDPRWPSAPYLYVHCDDLSGSYIRISRYRASGDLAFQADGALTVDPATRYDVLARLPDVASNHNGGTLRFGPDSTLYVSLGDDMDHCGAQDATKLLGKILRLEVRGLPDGAGGPPPRALLVAAGNPFAGDPDTNARLVVAQGLRNPFRFAVDPVSGKAMIGDVGENTYEEIDWLGTPGLGFGWPLYEGPALFDYPCTNPLARGDDPVAWYTHANGSAIIGGVFYRGAGQPVAFPAGYAGDFFYNDYYSGLLRRLHFDGLAWVTPPPESGQPSAVDWGTGFAEVSDWAMGPDGAMWYCRQSQGFAANTGDIRRVFYHPDSGVPPASGTRLELEPPWPTPAVGGATFRYTLGSACRSSLVLYDSSGRRVRVLHAPAWRDAGPQSVVWDGRDDDGREARPGLYLVRLEAAGRRLEQRVPFLR